MSDANSEQRKKPTSIIRDFPKIVSPFGEVLSESACISDSDASASARSSGPRSLDCGRARKRSRSKKQRDRDASCINLSANTTDSAPERDRKAFCEPHKSVSVPSLQDKLTKPGVKNVSSRIDTGLKKPTKKPIKTLLSTATSDSSVERVPAKQPPLCLPDPPNVDMEFDSAYSHDHTPQNTPIQTCALQTPSEPPLMPPPSSTPATKAASTDSRPQSLELGPICDPREQESRIRQLSTHVQGELNTRSGEKPLTTSASLVPPSQQMEAQPSTSGSGKRKLSTSPELEGFQRPKRTTKLSAAFRTRRRSETATSNAFTPLSDADAESDGEPSANQISAAAKSTFPRAPPKKSTTTKVPPIVLPGVAISHAALLQDLKSIIKGGFTIKYSYNSTLIYPAILADHRILKAALLDSGRKFHTYTTSDEVKHAFVLRGLDADVEIEEIKEELRDLHNIPVANIFRMKTKHRPLYLVVTSNTVTLKSLQQNVRHLQCIRVTWERRQNERRIGQCRRCQSWGHASSNCALDPRCVKCAGSHFSRECDKSLDSPPKCANCLGAHTACNLDCPVYQSKILALDQRISSSQQQPALKPAPPPTINAWEHRQQLRQLRSHATGPPTLPATSSSAPPSTKRFSQISAPPAAPPRQEAPTSAPSVSVSASGIGDLQSLCSEIKSINSKINLKQALLALKEFNKMLGTNPLSPSDKFFILSDFLTDVLPHYNL